MVTIQDAQKVTKTIVKSLDPLSIILFGSVARDNKGDDLDIVVIMDDISASSDELNVRLNKSLKPYYRKFNIDPFLIQRTLLSEYQQKGSPFLNVIAKEGRALYVKNAIVEWLKQAEEELDTAMFLLNGEYYKGACYHAQQAIEKSIKVKLLNKGWNLEKTHSIQRLTAIGKDYKINFKLSSEEIVFIDYIYRGRYPLETGLLPLGEPTRQDAERAVNIAERIVRQSKRILKKTENL